MPRNVIVKFEQGEPHTYEKVPDNISEADVKARAAKEFPNRKVIGTSTVAYKPDPKNLKPGEKPSVDIDQSSDKKPVAAPEEDSKKDYRADFPTLYTPPGFIRNKRGDLIYY